mgnify:CR=1 FL=1
MVRWLSANWIWVVLIGGMLWMHLGMHRGHGGHGGHGDHGRSRAPEPGARWSSRHSGALLREERAASWAVSTVALGEVIPS